MSEKRMLRGSVIKEESFRALPSVTQVLYLHMALDADDDGFISRAEDYCRRLGYSPARLTALAEAGYLIPFPSGAYALTHWCAHNSIPAEHYKPTRHAEDLARLRVDAEGRYALI